MKTRVKRLVTNLNAEFKAGGVSGAASWFFGKVRKKLPIAKPEVICNAPSETTVANDSLPPILDVSKMPVKPVIDRYRSFGDLRVAIILDDFSRLAWSGEFDVVAVTPQNWQTEIADGVDLLLVESAWNGNGGAWQYCLAGSRAPSEPLQKLVAHCKENGIPTVFWNKEDPPHYDDFIDTARLFDVVFTTDENKIPDYMRDLPHNHVDVMGFAAQPNIHNPIRDPKWHQLGDVAFGGMYFAHKYAERRQQMDILLGAATEVARNSDSQFIIYSRHAGGDSKYNFPEPFDQHVIGGLPYENMLSAYQANKVFLNVNSVTNSPTMCARRVFEILASGSSVVSTPSEAIHRYFPSDEVVVVENKQNAVSAIEGLLKSPELRDRMVHRAQRRIWNNHTYSHRAQQILEAIGYPCSLKAASDASVTVLAKLLSGGHLSSFMDQISKQVVGELRLILIDVSGDTPQSRVKTLAEKVGITDAVVIQAENEVEGYAKAYNLLSSSTGGYVASMDSRSLYGENYLADQINALMYSGADIVTKQAHYAYLPKFEFTIIKNVESEHVWTSGIDEGSAVFPQELISSSRMRSFELLTGAVVPEESFKIYSSDRFNYLVFDETEETGKIPWDIMATSTLAIKGECEEHFLC